MPELVFFVDENFMPNFPPLQGLPGRDGVSGSPGETGKDVSASWVLGGSVGET